jgi:hypothetical protein
MAAFTTFTGAVNALATAALSPLWAAAASSLAAGGLYQ